LKRLLALLIIMVLVFSNVTYAAKSVKEPVVSQEMTITQLAAVNEVNIEKLLKDLKIADNPQNRMLTLTALGIDNDTAKQAVRKIVVFNAEEQSKNWKKIFAKFALWGITIALAVYLLASNRVTSTLRTWQVFASFMIFGVLLGSDPSPMGTIKDTIALLGIEGIVFPPRLVAFVVFTITVVLANKVICGWGCQIGTLQDWLYRISPIRKKLRFSFSTSNCIRVTAFIAIVAAAFIFSFDLIGAVDPFKIFEPSKLTYLAGSFIVALLLISLFVYRPWCTFICPFGLTSWFFERYSWFRIRMDRDKCIQCGACRSVCPSQHANDLLNEIRRPADCFACGECLNGCPAKALQFSRNLKQFNELRTIYRDQKNG